MAETKIYHRSQKFLRTRAIPSRFHSTIFRKFGSLVPLTNLTKKEFKISNWDGKCNTAFEELKQTITQAPILGPPNWDIYFCGNIDASQVVVGEMLTKLDSYENDRVVAYHSTNLSPAEMNYFTNDRELLGFTSLLKQLECYSGGSSFEINTDDKVLECLFTQ